MSQMRNGGALMFSTPLRVLAVTAGLALAAGACGSDSDGASDTTAAANGEAANGGAGAAAPIALSLTESGCDPAVLTAPAGELAFAVDNARDAKAEFEIISSVPKIVTEEFLEAGESATYNVTLGAGEYQVICGAPSDTRAALTVTGDGGGEATLAVDAAELDAATAAYTQYVNEQVDQLVSGTAEFVAAVKAGDVAKAKELYAPVRRPWERIEPVAELFPDSDAVIDSRVDDFSGPDDPGFTGFHRIEKGLWEDESTSGLDTFADRLQTDVDDLAANVKSLTITPDVMVNGAAGLIEEAAQTKITGEEERYSKTDLDTFAANVDGALVIYQGVSPLLEGVDPALNAEIGDRFDTIESILTPYEQGDAYVPYDQLDETARTQLKAALAGLSENLALVAGAFGLEVA
jgi:iron uptake system component EfeO